jgi:Uma2 family endonuclease
MKLTMVKGPHLYRLSVDEYDAMIKAGIFDEDAPIELLDGELIHMSPQGDLHNNVVRQLNGLFHAAGVEPGTVLVQGSLHLNQNSEPEPDLVVLKPPGEQYWGRHIEPADVLLLVEVSDSSRLYDRKRKVPLYAKADIPEVWLVDLVQQLVWIYRRPEFGVYQDRTRAFRGETISAELLPSLAVEVNQILGPIRPKPDPSDASRPRPLWS